MIYRHELNKDENIEDIEGLISAEKEGNTFYIILEDLLIPLSSQFKFDINQNDNNESSVLVPLAEQDSLFSAKNSDKGIKELKSDTL